MPETDTSTRQRLLELWEKCPECRPRGGLTWQPVYQCWSIDSKSMSFGLHLLEDLAFDLACIAMVRWLADQIYCDVVGIHIASDGWGVVLNALNDGDGFVAGTLTDALISAVEAVLEKQNA